MYCSLIHVVTATIFSPHWWTLPEQFIKPGSYVRWKEVSDEKRFGIIFLGCSSKEPQNSEVPLIKQCGRIYVGSSGKFIKVLRIWRELQQPRWIYTFCAWGRIRTYDPLVSEYECTRNILPSCHTQIFIKVISLYHSQLLSQLSYSSIIYINYLY